jgi:2-octaprenylphenol hydroxylase
MTQKSAQSIMHPSVFSRILDVEVTLTDGQTLAANLLVGADGQSSWVRHQAKMQGDNYGLHTASSCQESAIVAILHSEYPHQKTCFQRFLEKGPVALLPLADPHLVSLVWSTSTSEAHRLMSISADLFNESLSRVLEKTLGHLTLCSDRVVFPLLRHQACHYVKPHIALIGDAAHSILPLAGQGLNAGLLDAACLAQIISWAQSKHRAIDSIDTLRRYELWRKGENTAMRWAMEGFYSGFSSTSELVRHLRHVGFSSAQKLPRMKKYFIQRAAGLRGDLPDIVKQS